MAFLGRIKKEDLVVLATELGEQVPEHSTVVKLKEIITKSKQYDESFVKELASTISSERIERAEVEEKRERAEHEIKMKELEIRSLEAKNKTKMVDRCSEEGSRGVGNCFLEYLKMMKGVMLDPPGKAEEWPFFFHHAERMFKLYEVPEIYQGKIIIHCLKGHSKGLNAMLKDEDFDNYLKIKELILREHRITPLQHKRNFDTCFKVYSESYAQYASRVEAALDLYLKSRKVDNLEKLKELLVADKIKDSLPFPVKSHIYLKETETWLSVGELVQEVDNFIVSVPKYSLSTQPHKNKIHDFPREVNPITNDAMKKKVFQNEFVPKKSFSHVKQDSENKKIDQSANIGANQRIIKCYKCQEEGHLRKFCPKVNSVAQTSKSDDDLEKRGLNVVCISVGNAKFGWEIPVDEAGGELPRIDLGIGCQKFQGIVDSGAEITVLRKSVVPEEYLQPSGKIFLRPALGSPVEAGLISVPLSLWTEEDMVPYVRVHVAVVEGLHEEALITPKVFKLLREQRHKYLGNEDEVVEKENSGKTMLDAEDQELSGLEILEEDVRTTPVEEVNYPEINGITEHLEESMSQAKRLKKEQLECPALQKSFTEAKQRKNNYWIESDLLYHMGSVGGQKYTQLVVPECKRKEILKLAHETPTSGHLAAKKTRDRIAMSFWWEGLAKDVKKWCEACHDCQMRKRIKMKDRAPIEAVGRPALPFQVVNADLLGPIVPKSSRGHQYVLCVVDQHSRWPEAIPIKSLTAKATCDAFMEIFTRTGIPRVIAMDNGTNFAAKLTQEFLKCVGCVPKFSTPGYPQSNGLVERWVGTMKSMLHHAINVRGKGWDKQLPFLLWAYREVPNETTGVAPFLLVHGRPPVGPLAILKSCWEDEVVLPQGTGESVSSYLEELRKRLEDAVQYADEVSKGKQEKYVHYHNLRSKDTEFSVGDEVVILIPDSTNKLCSRWKGPGEIADKISPHSYAVKLPDGSVRHLHQNKLRKYIQPIRTVGVIYELDEEFGEIQHAPIEQSKFTDQELDHQIRTDHLSSNQHQELCKLIREYKTIFDGKLKRAKVGSHVINLRPGVERKQPHLYKIPESLKTKVDKQISELLEKDLIEPSTAEIVYPLVCVAKKDGTIRLCVDYRALNAETRISPFPMQNSENLRFKAGGAKYLTTLDLLKGYWEIPLDEGSRELTSFVSSKGQYQWKVMPFGLSGAPGTFQKIMNQILRPHSDYADSFLDDIIIFSSGWRDHLNHIEAILKTLKELHFSANLGKCSFAMPKVKYLGHIVGSGEHGPDPEKIATIKNMKPPKTKKALRSILGLFNYYREYVPHYANMAKPLTDLTRKCVPNDLPWSEEAENSFNQLKDGLCSITSLSTPDMTKPYEIHTDASLSGIGACLLQRDNENKPRPITFASQKLTSAQSKWSTIEREAYAVIWALGKFEVWTYGTPITLHTDHNPLKFLTEGTPKNARLQRWSLALSRYHVSIAHKPGHSNTIADALSRIYE